MFTTGSLALAVGLGIAEHARFHPREVDLYVELPDVRTLVDVLAKAPAGHFVDDPDVQKLGTLAKQVGYDLGAIVRGAVPHLGTEEPGGRLFSPGDLSDVTLSWTGMDPVPGGATELAARAGMVIVCDFETEAGAERMTQALLAAQWLRMSDEGGDKLVLDGTEVPVQRHRLDAFFLELESWSVRLGKRWVLGAGVETPAAVAARWSGERPCLPAHAELFAGEKHLTPLTGRTIAHLYADLATIPFAEALGRAGLAEALITSLAPFAGSRGVWRIALREDRFVTESVHARIAAPTPFGALRGRGPVDESTASFVPKEAVGAWLTEVEPAQLPSLLRALVPGDGAGPGPGDAERETRMREAFSRAFGSRVALALLPITSLPIGGGGSLMPRLLVAVQLRDPAAALQALRDFSVALREQHPRLTVDERPYHKIPILVFSSSAAPEGEPGPANGSPIAGLIDTDATKPSIAVLSDRMILTLSPTHARAEIQRLEKQASADSGSEPHALAQPGRFPPDAIEASWMDWGGLVGKLYDTLRGFAPMLAQGQTLPFDPATLPTAAQFTRFFRPSFSWTKRIEDRLYTYSESSLGPETPWTIAALVTGLSRAEELPGTALLSGGVPGNGGAGTGTKAPSGSGKTTPPTKPAGEEAPQKETQAAMRTLKTGIAVYRSQTGNVPSTLGELLVGTESFPKGFLDPPAVPKDAWKREFHYVPDPGGVKYKLWSTGPDGADQQGAGDDVVAP